MKFLIYYHTPLMFREKLFDDSKYVFMWSQIDHFVVECFILGKNMHEAKVYPKLEINDEKHFHTFFKISSSIF